MRDIEKALRLSTRAEGASLLYIFFIAFVLPLTLENEVIRLSLMALSAVSTLIACAGILVPWELNGHRIGLSTPSEYASDMHEYTEQVRRLEGELYSLRSKIWEAEGRHSPLLKDTEFAFRLTEEEYEVFAASNSI